MSPKVKKAIMLSIFAFPGAGHIFLKHYKMAILFIVSFGAGASVIISNIMQKAQVVADQIVHKEIAVDVTTITQTILEQPDNFSKHTLTVVTWGLLILWQICIVDAYRLAKKNEQK